MNARRLRLIARSAAVLMLGLLVWHATQRLELARIALAIAGVRHGWLVLACVLYMVILPLWAAQWRLLAPRTAGNTLPNMLGVVALTSSALNTTPLLVGEAAGAALLVTQIGLEPASAVSVSVMDQLLVGMAKVAVIGAAALTNPLPAWMARGVLTLCGGVLILLSACLYLAWHPSPESSRIAALLPRRAANALGTFASCLMPLRDPGRFVPALLLALLKKLVEISAILCVARAFDVPLPLSGGLLVLATLNLATLLPVVPGNLGVYETAVVMAYVALGIPADVAAGIAVVQHACYFAALALPGLLWAVGAGAFRSAAAAR